MESLEDKDEIKLEENILSKMDVSKVFKHGKDPINNVDISRDGKYGVASTNDGAIDYYDILKGDKINTYKIKFSQLGENYGTACVKFTNHPKVVLVASKSKDQQHGILYWSLHDNKVLKIFYGHTSKIISIDTNSSFSMFVSVCENKEARVWDYDETEPIALFNYCQISCFDNTGKVLAGVHNPLDSEKKKIFLYNLQERNFGKPFSALNVELGINEQIESIKFSYDGKYILIGDTSLTITLMDAFMGRVIANSNLYKDTNIEKLMLTDFTPNSNLILFSTHGDIGFWDWSKNKIKYLNSTHIKKIRGLKFSTNYGYFVSAGQNLCIWTPNLD